MDTPSADREIIRIIQDYSRELRSLITLEGVYLFGSFVNGNANDHSDIDVLVVSRDFTGDIIEDMKHLLKLRRKVYRRIEPHPV